MIPRSRALTISGAASVLAHALGLAAMVWAPRIHLPEMPIPVEVRPAHRTIEKIARNRAGDPRASVPPPPIAPVAKPLAAKASRIGPGGPAPARPLVAPPPPPPPATTDLRPLGPGDARVVVMLRSDRLRLSPHRRAAQALLEALPDYHTLLGGTGLSAIDDFQALLIATSNPSDITATFLAARHSDDPRVRAALAKRILPAWDPRRILFLSPELSVLARPGDRLALDARADQATAGPRADPDGGIDDRAARWLDELAHFDQVADEPGAPSVLVSVSDLGALVRFEAGVPTPVTVALAATTEGSPSLRVRCAFATEVEARRFEAEWPAILRRFRDTAQFLALDALFDGLAQTREGATVELAGRIPERLMARALSWVVSFLPRRVYVDDPPADGGAPATSPAPIVAPQHAATAGSPSDVATQHAAATSAPDNIAPQHTSAMGARGDVAPQQDRPATRPAPLPLPLPIATPGSRPPKAPHSPIDSGVR